MCFVDELKLCWELKNLVALSFISVAYSSGPGDAARCPSLEVRLRLGSGESAPFSARVAGSGDGIVEAE